MALAGGVAALHLPWPAVAQRDVPVIGVLVMNPPEISWGRLEAVRQGLKEAGLTEGVDYALVLRFANGVFERLPDLAREIANLNPRVVIGGGNGADIWFDNFPATPMVFSGYAADPIKRGFGASFAHPGGQVTGNVMNAAGGEEALAGKRLGMLKELVPALNRIGFIGTKVSGAAMAELAGLRGVAGQFGCEIKEYMIEAAHQIEGAVAAGNQEGIDAIYVSGAPLLINNISRVLPHIMAANKPTIATYVDWARAGLLISYATNLQDGFRRAGLYAAKILRGARPGDLPIEQASKFSLVLNLKTAKQLGITVPTTLLAQADELIE